MSLGRESRMSRPMYPRLCAGRAEARKRGNSDLLPRPRVVPMPADRFCRATCVRCTKACPACLYRGGVNGVWDAEG